MNTKLTTKFLGEWGKYVEAKAASGKRIYLVTVMFKQMGGNNSSIRKSMIRELERIYGILVTRMVRKPRSLRARSKLPIFLASVDRPVFKLKQDDIGDVRINDGLHLHAIAIMPKSSRLGCGLQRHFRTGRRLYVRGDSKLARIHAVRVKYDPENVTGYALKGSRRSRDADDWIILPKARSELRKEKKRK
jgi:hypothetical protein